MKKYLSFVFIFVFLLTFVLPFKSSHALSPTVPCTVFNSDLKFSDGDNNTGGDISRLQGFLNAYQGSSLKIDGFYGISTLKEVVKFQKDNNISPSVGYIGSLTRAKIQEVSCKPYDPIPPCPEGTTGTYPNCVKIKPTVTLKATPDSVPFGGSTVLTWSSTNATSCLANNWFGPVNVSGGEGNALVNKTLNGSEVVPNMETTKTFSIYCTGPGGQTFQSVDVGVYIADDFPEPSCPEGTTGVYPNCKKIETPPIECPAGYTGQYPDCIKIETPSPSCLELTYNLKITDRDSFTKGEVSKLQNFLKLQGYLNENPTGYFGAATLGAVIKFQKANNISPAVGFVGAYTRAKIKEVSCNTIYGSGANNNSVKVLSPNGGELFRPLDQVEVKFKVKDLENNKYKIALAYYPTNNSQPILLNDINKNNGELDNIDIQLPFICRIGNLQEWSFPGSYNSPEAEEDIKHSLQLEGCDGASSFPASSWTSNSLLELELFMPPLSLIIDKNNLSFDSSEYQKIKDLNRLHLYDFSGKKFKLFIQELDKNGKIIGEDYSDDFFSILPQDLKEGCVQGIDYTNSSIKCPSIKINTNNEVKNYKPGEKIEVSWTSKNIPKNAWVALSLQDQNTKIKYFIASYLPTSEKITYFFPENIKQNDIADGESIGHVYERLVNKNFKVVADLYLGSGSIYAFDYDNIIQSAVPVNFGGIITNSPSIILKPHLLASDSSDNTFKMLPSTCFNGLQDFGETGIDVGGPCGEIINSCPEGTTGIYPNCVLPPVPTPVNSTSSANGCQPGYKFNIINGVACSLQNQQLDQITTNVVSTIDKTPRISYWSGKVNQHIDQNGNWQTDPDGASGSSLNKLAYCQKWYPTTTSTRDYKNETINTWRAGGNTGTYSATRMSTECVGGSVSGVLGVSIENSCVLTNTLMKGMKAEEVKCLQKKLNQKGYNVLGTEGGRETNEFGYYTNLALRKLQAENNLKVDGIVGFNTRALLNK